MAKLRPRPLDYFEEIKGIKKEPARCNICGRRFDFANQACCPWCTWYENHEHVAPKSKDIPKWIKEDLLQHKGFIKKEDGTYKPIAIIYGGKA